MDSRHLRRWKLLFATFHLKNHSTGKMKTIFLLFELKISKRRGYTSFKKNDVFFKQQQQQFKLF